MWAYPLWSLPPHQKLRLQCDKWRSFSWQMLRFHCSILLRFHQVMLWSGKTSGCHLFQLLLRLQNSLNLPAEFVKGHSKLGHNLTMMQFDLTLLSVMWCYHDSTRDATPNLWLHIGWVIWLLTSCQLFFGDFWLRIDHHHPSGSNFALPVGLSFNLCSLFVRFYLSQSSLILKYMSAV